MTYMVLQRVSDKKFLSMQGPMNEIIDADFFHDEEEALKLARQITEHGHDSPVEVIYVTITLSNVKGDESEIAECNACGRKDVPIYISAANNKHLDAHYINFAETQRCRGSYTIIR